MSAHWSEKYVGIPVIEGEFDCADLARLVQREVFGRDIKLPSDRLYSGKRGVAKLEAMTEQIENLKADYAERTEQPADGDGVLIQSRGHMDHIGIYCVISGMAWVLHAAGNSKQVVLQRLNELVRYGLKLEGFYRWI